MRTEFLCISVFPLPFGVWEGLRFVIVAHHGLFSYLFFNTIYQFIIPFFGVHSSLSNVHQAKI